VCSGSGSTTTTGRWEQVTVDQVNNFNNTTNCTFFLTNCLLVASTNTGPYSGANNASNTTPANVFQTVGAGAHYLPPGSQYRDSGTTNLSASCLSSVRGRTTFAPTVLATGSSITVSTTLNPTAQRDTDVPDLGWHYSPIDWAANRLGVSNATLTVNPGTIIAIYGTDGIRADDGGSLVF